jgi:hypothetical protein
LEGRQNYEAIGLPAGARLTNQQKRKLWLLQHPQYEYGNKPDMFLEGTLTGPYRVSGCLTLVHFSKI